MAADTYYLSAQGDDHASGREKSQAWRTLKRASDHVFASGEEILLRGGDTFDGNLILKKRTPDAFVRIASFGRGRAKIVASQGKAAIFLYNMGRVELRNLEICQQGDAPDLSGIMAYCDDATGKKFSKLVFEDLVISGFGMYGLCVGADSGSLSGFDQVTIRRVTAHRNRMAGISSWGYTGSDQKGWSHSNFRITECIAHDNYGIPDKRDNHSGSGIMIGGVADAVIEGCEAFENGKDCFCPKAGPVGIWAWDATRVVIRDCISHHNRTGAGKDGGGFDLDGGVTDSVMENNESYENAGAGYLVCQYAGARTPLARCVVRKNKTRHDGTVSSLAGICVAGYDKTHPVTGIVIEDNEIVPANGTLGIFVAPEGSEPCSVTIRRNVIQEEGISPIRVGTSSRSIVTIETVGASEQKK